LFKLHAPFNVIAGGGTFLRSQKLPLRLAWEVFESSNGVFAFLRCLASGHVSI
jgi:putative restriction endonuclease